MNLPRISPERAQGRAADWPAFVEMFRTPGRALTPPFDMTFAPLREGCVDDLMVMAQLGQSLDGRIATPNGHSKYINGCEGLDHLHRLRALVDAVVIGVGTALADDPQLTVRRVSGPNPARIVLDPQGRLPPGARLLADDGARRIVIGCEAGRDDLPAGVEHVALAKRDGQLAPSALLAELAARGLRRILIEGGADTISRFAHAGCLDRLHVVVAPIILGAGRAGINLPSIERVDQAMRTPMRAMALGEEVLLDCDLSAQRRPVGRAKKSR